jgi:hypothetical protein
MKELVINAGGRRLYNEDLLNIQDHLISVHSLFASEEPFVLSGLQYTLVSGNVWNISSGVVWLGGKIRNAPAISNVSLDVPRFIITSDTQESRLYDDNVSRSAVDVLEAIHSTTSSGVGVNELLRIDDINLLRRYYKDVLGGQYVRLNAGEPQSIDDGLTVDGSLGVGINLNVASNGTFLGSVTTTWGYYSDTGGLAINPNGTVATNKVVTDSIANQAINSDKIDAGAVLPQHIQQYAVTTNKIGLEAVTHNQLSTDSVTTDKVLDGTITMDKLATSAKNLLSQVDSLPSGNLRIKTKVIEIGNWNMDINSVKTTLHGLSVSQASKITSISATIQPDNNVNGSLIALLADGFILVNNGDQTRVYLSRNGGGTFDNSNFSGSTNRGYIEIRYME